MSLIEVQDLLTFIDGTEKEPKKVTLIEAELAQTKQNPLF